MAKQDPHRGAAQNKNGSHPGTVKKAMRRVEQARASYARAEERVANLRMRLTRAEEKLSRRVVRLSAAEEVLATLAAPPELDVSGPAEGTVEVAVAAQEDQRDPATGDPGAGTLTAPVAYEASSSDGGTTPADVATEPAVTAQSVGARPARSRRKPASQGES